MSYVPVPESRIQQFDSPDGLQFIIPAKRKIFLMLFLGFWLIGWGFGEVTVTKQLFFSNGPNSAGLFMLAWLGGWTIGGAFAIFTWVWMLAGQERITLRSDALIHRREVFGLGLSREYGLTSIRDLRIAQQPASSFSSANSLQFWGISGGLVAFDYGSRTIQFGASLEEAEAKSILKSITSRSPNLANTGVA